MRAACRWAPTCRRAGPERPVFAVSALRDPGTRQRPGVALQRIQIVKGWVEDGAARERVFEVAGDPENGASVDLATCTPRGAGRRQPVQRLERSRLRCEPARFYYARVVENPSCRWSTFACNAKGVDCSDRESVPEDLAACCEPGRAKTIQERSWTSPIWYTPARMPAQAHAMRWRWLRAPGGRISPRLRRARALRAVELAVARRPTAAAARASGRFAHSPTDAELLEREARRLGLDRDDSGIRRRLVRNLRFLGEGTTGDEQADYEEALALGLDGSDLVVRRRLVQRLELHALAWARASEPTDAELAALLVRESGALRAARARASHARVPLARPTRGLEPRPRAGRRARRSRLASARAPERRSLELGDPFLLGSAAPAAHAGELAASFGDAFARAVAALPPGRWSGPIASSYGLHRVFVQERTPGARGAARGGAKRPARGGLRGARRSACWRTGCDELRSEAALMSRNCAVQRSRAGSRPALAGASRSPRRADAHPLAPSLLELREQPDGVVAVRFRTPRVQTRGRGAVGPSCPPPAARGARPARDGCQQRDAALAGRLRPPADCAARALRVHGLRASGSDALLRASSRTASSCARCSARAPRAS